VPGVVDVSGWAGKTKNYSVTVDLDKLLSYGLTLPQMLQTLSNSNINVGGQTVNFGPQAAIVRGVGLIHTMDDLRNTMLTSSNGSPVYVNDVATVTVGNQPRLGIVGQDDDEDIVQGIVLMRRGEQTLPTIGRVEAEVAKINSAGILPPGVRLEKMYDRRELINITTHTVLHNMVFGIVLIFFVQWLFLGNLRSAVIVATTIPLALFFAISILVLRGESANLLTETIIVRGLRRIYKPVLEFAVANRILTLGGAGLLARSASNSCLISRKAICGSAPLCLLRSPWKRRCPMLTVCGRSSEGFPRW
jgi:heavy metal efflux system protein